MIEDGNTLESGSDTPRQVRSLVEAVCVRPRMYTLGGTFEEIACFLQGFHSGSASHTPSPPPEAEAWFEFCDWLHGRLLGGPGPWWAALSTLRRAHQDDLQAFAALASLYIEFQHEWRENRHG
jgi:hypothetical protein